MAKKNEIVEDRKHELLDIFIREEDRKGTDILAMSDFFDVLIGKMNVKMDSEIIWEIPSDIEVYFGSIAAAIKCGHDISKMGMLVADDTHFGPEIIDGLKKGIYHIGKSKEVAGNLRPAIVDENGRLIKIFTLKKAFNPTEVLSDISTLSMQILLKKISVQIENVERNAKRMNDSIRRENLEKPFLNARDKIMSASTEGSVEKQENCLKDADDYLMEGLNALYLDLRDQVKELANKKGVVVKIKEIDTLLCYIGADMEMIPRYVGLRVYLLNYRGKYENANRILEEYQYKLQTLAEQKIGDEKYTAFELIHEYYPYKEENMDFWLERPKQMLETISFYKTILEQKDTDIFYINVEDSNGEG